jgi:tripeptide aminopeptidase
MSAPASMPEAHLRIAALASDPAVHRAFRWLHLHEPQLRRWQLEFLAIPAPAFAESDRAHWFLDRFRDLGLDNPHIDAEGNALAELRPISPKDAVILSGDSRNASPREPESKDPDGPGSTPSRVPHSSTAPSSMGGVQTPTGAQPSEPPHSPDAEAPIILISAHLDTVFPAGTDCTPHQQPHSDRIAGPGACDNGAGLTALLALVAALQHAAILPACTILFAANVGEEGEGDLRGMRHLFGVSPYAGRIRAALALEGSGATTVVDRALGSRRLRVALTGPGGHSWANAGRPNPILALSTALLAVATLPLPANPRTTLNCGTIRGGTSVNSIPESATADLDLRSTSPLELDRTELAVLHTLSATLEAENLRTSHLSGAPGSDSRTSDILNLRVTRIGDRPAAALAPSSPLAASLRAVDRHLHLATEFRIGSTDANLPLSLGIPALAIGAGGSGGGIHTLAEWYSPTGRDLALRRILLLLLDACNVAVQ